MSADTLVQGQTCSPNITEAGRQRRIRFAIASSVFAAATLAAGVAFHWAPWFRALVFLPVAGAAVGFLQVQRNTCVARAREGTFEHDDGSTTPASAADVAASRKVASGIMRDAMLIGALGGALAAATALL